MGIYKRNFGLYKRKVRKSEKTTFYKEISKIQDKKEETTLSAKKTSKIPEKKKTRSRP